MLYHKLCQTKTASSLKQQASSIMATFLCTKNNTAYAKVQQTLTDSQSKPIQNKFHIFSSTFCDLENVPRSLKLVTTVQILNEKRNRHLDFVKKKSINYSISHTGHKCNDVHDLVHIMQQLHKSDSCWMLNVQSFVKLLSG